MMAYQTNHILIITVIILCYIALTHNQRIHINDNVNYYSHEERRCKQSLLHEKDDVHFESQINISGMFDSLDCVEYQLKKKGQDYTPICFLNLKQCQGYEDSSCYCRTTKIKDVYDVVINITAMAHNSEAYIRGRLSFLDRDVFSNEQRLPAIYEPLKEEVFIYINNIPMDIRKCNIRLNNSAVVLVFQVIDQLNLPCQLTIKNSQTGLNVETNSTTLSHAADVIGNNSFIMSYQYCGLTSYYNSFTCNIETPLSLESPMDVEASVVIDNELMNATNCKIELNDTDVVIVFYVNDQRNNIPCQLTIKDNQTGLYVQSNSMILSYTTHLRGNNSFILTYELCGLTQLNNSFTCIIETRAVYYNNENMQHQTSTSNSHFHVLYISAIVLLLLTPCSLIFFVAFKNEKLKMKRNGSQGILKLLSNTLRSIMRKSVTICNCDNSHSYGYDTKRTSAKKMFEECVYNNYEHKVTNTKIFQNSHDVTTEDETNKEECSFLIPDIYHIKSNDIVNKSEVKTTFNVDLKEHKLINVI